VAGICARRVAVTSRVVEWSGRSGQVGAGRLTRGLHALSVMMELVIGDGVEVLVRLSTSQVCSTRAPLLRCTTLSLLFFFR
jgi:hypothetical protein